MKIILKDLRYEAKIGARDWEKQIHQNISIDVELEYDATKAMVSDKLDDAVDYGRIENIIRKVIQQKHYHLLEHLAHVLAQTLQEAFPCQYLKVTLRKTPWPNASYVAVVHEVRQ